MDTKYKVNDTVLYGADGVCRITEISEKEMAGVVREYYILQPISRPSSVIYVPTNNERLCAKLKSVLTKNEIQKLINDMPTIGTMWIENENERKLKYKEILQSGDRSAIVSMIKTLSDHQKKVKENGRKMHVCDEKFMKNAEKILYDEFAHVLGIESSQVIEYIMSLTGTV